MAPMNEAQLGAVLVIGGNGFVGYHVAQYLVKQKQPGYAAVSVLSRNKPRDVIPGVSYYTGDISTAASLEQSIEKIGPAVIVHAACPSAITARADTYQAVIVDGTRNLLDISLRLSSVKAFVYTSSATAAAGPVHRNLDEATLLADTDPHSHPYAKFKAIADKMVLKANKPDFGEEGGRGLLTGCIRLPIVYGERDLTSVPGCLGALEKNQTNVILGEGLNLWDFVSTENAAYAHHLLAMALLKRLKEPATAPRVDGEAFNICDGERHRFWDYPRSVWKAAGWIPPVKDKPMKLSPTFLLLIASCLEWVYWIFTRGQKRPTTMSKQQVEYACFEHTYQIDKARRMLGYRPEADFGKGVREAVKWSLENDGWDARLASYRSNRAKQL